MVTLCDKLEDLWTLSICHNKTFYAKECWEVRLGFLKGMCCIWPVRSLYSLRSGFWMVANQNVFGQPIICILYVCCCGDWALYITDAENKKKWWNCSLTRKKVPFKGHKMPIIGSHFSSFYDIFYFYFFYKKYPTYRIVLQNNM